MTNRHPEPVAGQRVVITERGGWAEGHHGVVVREALPEFPGRWTVQLDDGAGKFLALRDEVEAEAP